MEPEVLELILAGRKKATKLQFSLLSNITKKFSEEREIGKGGFATVYKGVLPNGNVAVKRIMNRHTINDALFDREVDTLLAVNHQNIVQFVGYCASTEREAYPQEGSKAHIHAEQRERLLCFEYIANGSLQEHITDELRGLEWSARYEIIKGICNGLDYLHNEKEIYHMDLKPANVLLDSNMVPKIIDFGQSRYDGKSQTISINRYGSRGYCPPEYIMSGKMSPKSDMYSLGMIIIELVTGDKEIPNNNKSNVLRRWRHRWRKPGKASPLGYQQVTKCIDIGLLCQEIDPHKRPSIRDIVHDINKLEGTNSQNGNANESTLCLISTDAQDDMLGIEPLELHFPFEINKEMSCLLQLTNDTDSYIAFEVQKMSSLPYCQRVHRTEHKGIIPPHIKCSVDIILQPQDKEPQRANKFIVRSTKVKNGLTPEDITTAIFSRDTGNIVDEVNLDVIFDVLEEAHLPSSSSNMPMPELYRMTSSYAELEKKLQDPNTTPMCLPLEFLKTITCDFSTESELGRGHSGVVYKGVFQSGKIIAVKKLFELHLINDKAFQNEISYLMGIKHQNVVQFVGYCAESRWKAIELPSGKHIWAEIPERLLCFEYVSNKSLDTHIADRSFDLEWNIRYKIIMGICNGLHFLHEECRIIHLDLTLHNILMDSNMKPKIADFGMSRIFGEQQTIIFTDNCAGRRGYMAPEYLTQGLISKKADIFSLGVIIIEIVTGRRHYPYFQLDSPESTATSCQQFTEEVLGSWRNKFESTSEYMSTEIYSLQVKQCIDIALKCVDPGMEKRPTTKDIIEMLNAVYQEAPQVASSFKKLTDAIHEFYAGDISYVSMDELCRCAYNLVFNAKGKELYSLVETTMAAEVQDLGRDLNRPGSADKVFLGELLAKWYQHTTATTYAGHMLCYMDKTVPELGLRLWRDRVVRSDKILPRLIEAMKPWEMQGWDRDAVPAHLIASVTDMLKKLGDDVYQEVLGMPARTE